MYAMDQVYENQKKRIAELEAENQRLRELQAEARDFLEAADYKLWQTDPRGDDSWQKRRDALLKEDGDG